VKRYGSHTELAYSRIGLTRDTYAFSLIDLLEMFMFLLRKLMVLLALEEMVLICLPSIGDGSKKGCTICY
jgi:hypothetical protein